MDYYHYISNTKVDMLYPQIPQEFLDGIKVELGFNIGILQGKLAGQHHDRNTTVARAKAIETFFEKEGLLKPEIIEGMWLQTEFTARTGFLPDCPGLVLFGGRIDDTVLLLAGSEANMTSGSPNQGNSQGWSFMPRVLHALNDFLRRDFDLLVNETIGDSYSGKCAASMVFGGEDHVRAGAMFHAFLNLPKDALPEPEVNLSFLARIFLVRSNQRGERLAIGSPLYISERT